MSDEEALEPLILKKKLKGADGGHGGAWKVAYADFVTAMMAFFLLLWLLNATTSDQKQGLSQYFQPQTVTSGDESGSGGMLGGLAVGAIGNLRSAGSPPSITVPIPSAGGPKERKGKAEATLTSKDPNPESTNFEARKRESESFEKAQADLRLAVEQTQELSDFQDSLLIEETPDGLRIQMIDGEKASMFEPGTAQFTPYFKALLQIITRVVTRFPNPVSVSGHTDSAPLPLNATYTRWDLSGDRANAARRVMTGAGLPDERMANVTGRADTDHLFPREPNAPSNRRISILLQRVVDENSGDANEPEKTERGQ